jgi:hypothetical protein
VTTTRTSSPFGLRAPLAVAAGLRAALVLAVGLAVGVLTSVGQTYLGGVLNAFVNSASAWLIAPFFLGAVMPSRRTAAAAGLTAALAQLFGYYATAHLRGYPAGGAIVVFWAACGLVGGPLFGAGGHLWRSGSPHLAGLGATLLPAAFLAEGLWVYLHELHYHATAALWIGIGVTLAALLPSGFIQRRWLPLTLILGIAGEIAVSHIYRQTF